MHLSFQVPFIAFYRKEYVEPELNINDLWKVWQWDEKVDKERYVNNWQRNNNRMLFGGIFIFFRVTHIKIVILCPPVDPAEDPQAESYTSVPEDAVLPV